MESGLRLSPFLVQQLVEELRRTAHLVGHDHQSSSVKQRSPHFPNGKVKCIGVEQSPDIVLVEVKPRAGRLE